MTDFDYSKVYTAVNADKLKIGSKVYVAKNLHDLRDQVQENSICTLCTLSSIRSEEWQDRFAAKHISDGVMIMSPLAYLVSEPEKKKLKWTDLKIGDLITKGERTAMVTSIDGNDRNQMHVFAGSWIIDDELEAYEKLEEDDDR